MVNRSAVILRYQEPAIRWINEADSSEQGAVKVQVKDTWEDANVYLISDEDGHSKQTALEWVAINYDILFEMELENWYTDPDLWPQKRTYELFQEWFKIEFHSVLLDTVGTSMLDDEIEQPSG